MVPKLKFLKSGLIFWPALTQSFSGIPKLTPDEVKKVLLEKSAIRKKVYFINYPPEKFKEIISDLYRGWVYNSAE